MFLFSKRLKELRKKNGFTQQQLGDMVGVTKVSICCYENGTRTPTLDTLVDLANCLNIDLPYFLGAEYFAIAEDDSKCTINMAKDEIELIRELRMHTKLYEKLLEDPKRTMDYFEKKMR
ncbi:MAG: helix-turn-helix transcriptional regulator [Lachnospiraceae bacterium]|nr:helix-turn-helix transcriptional regulator [Lachnospiraceae bacterium]